MIGKWIEPIKDLKNFLNFLTLCLNSALSSVKSGHSSSKRSGQGSSSDGGRQLEPDAAAGPSSAAAVVHPTNDQTPANIIKEYNTKLYLTKKIYLESIDLHIYMLTWHNFWILIYHNFCLFYLIDWILDLNI